MPPSKANGNGKGRHLVATADAFSYNLPEDVLCIVFQMLPFKELVRSAGVCKAWHSVARDPHTWQGRGLDLRGLSEGLSNVADVFLPLVESVVMWDAERRWEWDAKECRSEHDLTGLPHRARDAVRAMRERLRSISDETALSEAVDVFGADSWEVKDGRNHSDHLRGLRDKLYRKEIEMLEGAACLEDAQRLCLHGKVPNGRIKKLDLSGAHAAKAGFFAVIAEHLAPQLETFVCKISTVSSALVRTSEDDGETRRALMVLLRRAGRLSVLRLHHSCGAAELVAVAEATSHSHSLREIDCSWSDVTDEAVARLAAAAPHLQLFTYTMVDYGRSGSPLLTFRGAKAIRDQCPAATVDIRLPIAMMGCPRHPLEKYTMIL